METIQCKHCKEFVFDDQIDKSTGCYKCVEALQSEPQHTPTPWKIDDGGVTISSAVDETIIASAHGGNAAFIVRAVNSHEELLKIADEFLKYLTMTAAKLDMSYEAKMKLGSEIRNAIAKAEGKE